MTLFLLHPFILALLLLWRLVLPLNAGLKLKLILTLLCVAGSLKQYAYVLTGGTLMDPGLGHFASLIWNMLNFSVIFLLLLCLARDLINLPFKLLRLKLSAALLPAGSLKLSGLLILIAASLGVTGTLNGFGRPDTVRYELTIDGLPRAADGFKIVLLADLHVARPTSPSNMDYIVETANALNPDLTVIAGDLQDGAVEDLSPVTDKVFSLKARLGVYAISGNHEFYSGYKEWLSHYEKGGLPFLENKTLVIKDENGAPLFNLAGVTDPNAGRFGFEGPDFESVLNKTDPMLPVVMLSHRPQYAHEVKDRVALYLAGHTHGGMCPGLRELVKNANGGLVSGLYELGKEKVIVSNGTLIWMGFPLRILTPAQLIEITLRAPSGETAAK